MPNIMFQKKKLDSVRIHCEYTNVDTLRSWSNTASLHMKTSNYATRNKVAQRERAYFCETRMLRGVAQARI